MFDLTGSVLVVFIFNPINGKEELLQFHTSVPLYFASKNVECLCGSYILFWVILLVLKNDFIYWKLQIYRKLLKVE